MSGIGALIIILTIAYFVIRGAVRDGIIDIICLLLKRFVI